LITFNPNYRFVVRGVKRKKDDRLRC